MATETAKKEWEATNLADVGVPGVNREMAYKFSMFYELMSGEKGVKKQS